MFEFELQKRSHKVERLPVHLPNQQLVIFREGENISTLLEKFLHTKLTRYFERCANDPESNSNLRYIDFPKNIFGKKENGKKEKKVVKKSSQGCTCVVQEIRKDFTCEFC